MHELRIRDHKGERLVIALAMAAFALTGCADEDDPPVGTEDVPDIRGEDDLTDPYTGAYDEEFTEDVEVYAGVEMTLEAEVAEVFSSSTFTITAPDGTDVPPILVVYAGQTDLAPGDPVVVAATPDEELDLQEAEEAIGSDLDDGLYAEWVDEPYLLATQVEPAPVQD